jgi:hypothetical protein
MHWTALLLLALMCSMEGSVAFQQAAKSTTRKARSSVLLGAMAKPPTATRNQSLDRRSFFVSSAAVLLMAGSSPPAAHASDVRAPIELLLPATRVKLYIDKTIDVCESFPADKAALEELKRLLQEPQQFMTSEEVAKSKQYLEINTLDPWNKARQTERENKGASMGIDYTTPYDKFNTAIQQWGDRRQFRTLRGRQLALEQSSAMRAALNAYTNNLVFGDGYQLNAEGAERKQMIRNDALPNVQAVVVSDLDLRDLYRNQILQSMDDAKAELEYQLANSEGFDSEEILLCLKNAQSSYQEWFKFIPKDDVDDALKAVLSEAS